MEPFAIEPIILKTGGSHGKSLAYRRWSVGVRHDDDIGYYGGWTISGLAVVATITAVWLFGI